MSEDSNLDGRLFVVVTLLLLLVAVGLIAGFFVQWHSYQLGIDAALKANSTDHAAILSYNRALGAAVVKTSALFLGFLLSFTGTLYVLRKESVRYSGELKSEGYAVSLATTSPGLVIITLGVVLIAVTILSHSDVSYQGPAPPSSFQASDQVEGQEVNDTPSTSTTVPPSERK